MKNNVIALRAGEHREATMPAHSGATPGIYTFAVGGLDMDQYTQWSVIGAAHSELAKDDLTKIGNNKCIITIPDDQGHEEKIARVVNVSVIGTDTTTKQQVETTATLTLKIYTNVDETDFTFYSHHPERAVYTEASSTLAPSKFEIKAHLSESVMTVDDKPNFTATCIFDIQGAHRSEVFPMTLMPGSDKVFKVDVTNQLKAAAAAMDNRAEFLECSYEIEVHKHHLVAYKDSYMQVSGDRFILERIRQA